MLDWAGRSRSFAAIGGFMANVGGMVMGNADGLADTVSRQWVTAGIFDALGVQPIAGRAFLPSTTTASAPTSWCSSEAFWRSASTRDPSIVGRDVRLDGEPYTVVGVVPDSAQLIGSTDLWALISIHDAPPRARAAPRSSGGRTPEARV